MYAVYELWASAFNEDPKHSKERTKDSREKKMYMTSSERRKGDTNNIWTNEKIILLLISFLVVPFDDDMKTTTTTAAIHSKFSFSLSLSLFLPSIPSHSVGLLSATGWLTQCLLNPKRVCRRVCSIKWHSNNMFNIIRYYSNTPEHQHQSKCRSIPSVLSATYHHRPEMRRIVNYNNMYSAWAATWPSPYCAFVFGTYGLSIWIIRHSVHSVCAWNETTRDNADDDGRPTTHASNRRTNRKTS